MTPRHCRHCNKQLRKRTYWMVVGEGDPDPLYLWPDEPFKRTVRKVMSRKQSLTPGKHDVRVWCGDWGNYGDDKFCGLRCGYNWAVGRP